MDLSLLLQERFGFAEFRPAQKQVIDKVMAGENALAGMVAFLSLKDIKLNFLNFVSLPITFGIGVDYAVNVMQRARADGVARMHHIIVETGGAVVACSDAGGDDHDAKCEWVARPASQPGTTSPGRSPGRASRTGSLPER